MNGEIFGFLLCDLQSPPELIERILPLNFPPIIRKAKINYEHLSAYMRRRVKEENTKMPQETLINSFHGNELLIFTPMIIWLIKLGVIVKNIKWFIQYTPSKCLLPFVNNVTAMRVKATYEGSETKANSSKLIGNAGWGKTAEQVARYTNTKIIGQDKLEKNIPHALYVDHFGLQTEYDDGDDIFELTKKPHRISDDKPVMIGQAILQYSKLHLLKFAYFLYYHLKPGSFRLVYCDTDSLGIGLI